MIYSADSELATNWCWSLGTTGELRTFRGSAHSGSLTRLIIPLSAETAKPFRTRSMPKSVLGAFPC
jgi:hypothetical protein